MALDPMLWALKDAPVATAEEAMVLVVLAEAANEDGTDAFPSKDTIAARARVSVSVVKRILRSFRDRGILGAGNQDAAHYIPKRLRPIVYDVCIPYRWFPNVDRINANRAMRGLEPLTVEQRPNLGAAPAKTARADKGKSNPKRSPRAKQATTTGQGGLTDPPVYNSDRGVCESTNRGVCESREGGLTDPQLSPLTLPWRNSSKRARVHAYVRVGTLPAKSEEEKAPAGEEHTERDTHGETGPVDSLDAQDTQQRPGQADPTGGPEYDTNTIPPSIPPEIPTQSTATPCGSDDTEDGYASGTQGVSALTDRFFRALPTHVCPNRQAQTGKAGAAVAALLTDGWADLADGPEQLAQWFTGRIPRGGVSSPAGWLVSQCGYAPPAPQTSGAGIVDGAPVEIVAHAACPNRCDEMHMITRHDPATGNDRVSRCEIPHRRGDRTQRHHGTGRPMSEVFTGTAGQPASGTEPAGAVEDSAEDIADAIQRSLASAEAADAPAV